MICLGAATSAAHRTPGTTSPLLAPRCGPPRCERRRSFLPPKLARRSLGRLAAWGWRTPLHGALHCCDGRTRHAPAPAHGRLGAARPRRCVPASRGHRSRGSSASRRASSSPTSASPLRALTHRGFTARLRLRRPRGSRRCRGAFGMFILTPHRTPRLLHLGDACQPLILSNYHPTDDGCTCARPRRRPRSRSFPLVSPRCARPPSPSPRARSAVEQTRRAWILTGCGGRRRSPAVARRADSPRGRRPRARRRPPRLRPGGAIMDVAPASMHAAERAATGSGMGTAAAAATRGASRCRSRSRPTPRSSCTASWARWSSGRPSRPRQRGAGGGDDAEHVAVAAAR